MPPYSDQSLWGERERREGQGSFSIFVRERKTKSVGYKVGELKWLAQRVRHDRECSWSDIEEMMRIDNVK